VRLQVLAGAVLDFVFWAVLAATVYSFVHAAMQRPDAYTAADKLTKPVWLVILGAAGLFSWVLGIMGLVLAAVASGVYLADVRPRLLEVQGKSR
jgi:hypothetical protein